MTISCPSTNSVQNISDLRIIDVYKEENGEISIKLQNTGTGSALVYEIRFLFYEGFLGNKSCSPIISTTYTFPFSAQLRDQVVSLQNKLGEKSGANRISNVPEDLLHIPSKFQKQMGSSGIFIAKQDNPIFLSPPLKIPEEVAAGGVAWIKVKVVPAYKPPMIPCGLNGFFTAHIVLYYDDGRKIITPYVDLKW